MLAGVTPEQFDEWMEMNSIVPFGDEKLAWVMAKGFAVLANRLNYLAASWGAKDLKDPEPKDFIVWSKRKTRPKKSDYVSPNQAAALFKLAVANGGR